MIHGALAVTIPESPRFLISAHKIRAATTILTKFLGEPHIERRIERIRQSMERETEPSWRDLKNPNGRIAGIVWIGLLSSVFQQFVGINVIFCYFSGLPTG